MFVAKTHLAFRTQHAIAGDAANLGRLEFQAGARNGAAAGRKNAFHAGARIGRAAHHLQRIATGIDGTKPELVGVGMLHRLDDMGDDERREFLCGVLDALNLKADRGHTSAQRLDGSVGLQMLFEPGKRELHRVRPPTKLGTSPAAKP